MPNLFNNSQGSAYRITGGAVGRFTGRVDLEAGTTKLSAASAGIIVSGIGVSQQTKVAYFSTLGDSMYIYPLGNEMSKAIITGIALPACGSKTDYSNAKSLIDFYNNNKASNFKAVATPLVLSLEADIKLKGFLEGMTLEVSNAPNEFGFAKFTLTMSIIPE